MHRRAHILCSTLLLTLCAQSAIAGPRKGPGVPVDGVPFINSRRVQISFNSGPHSQNKATLYVTRDRGKTWHLVDAAVATQPPIIYDATEDGLFGFFIVLENDAGQSSPVPQSGTSPQQWVRIDTAPPSVQLLGMKADDDFKKNREIRMRWRCDDENLTDRPVSIHFRTEESKVYVPLAEWLPANSEYRWIVPASVKGRVEIKLTASDLAGKIGEYRTDRLLIDESGAHTQQRSELAESNSQASIANRVNPVTAPYGEPDADGRPASADAAKEARKQYEQGTFHRLRGESELASTRFEKAVALDPGYLEAWHDLAGVQLQQGQFERAEQSLRQILKRDPRNVGGLKGLALVLASERNYKSARQTLEQLLILSPRDPEIWLYYGDVSMFSGDRAAAKDAWAKAADMQQGEPGLRQRAQKRLEIYSAAANMPDELQP